MSSMNISLPELLKSYVRERVGEGDFSNSSDYVRALIRDDKKRWGKNKLEDLLLEGVNSGEATEMTSEDWDEIRSEVHTRLKNKMSK